jgi:hypothetical protein
MIEDKDLDTWGRHMLSKVRKSKFDEMQNYNEFITELALRPTRNEDGVLAVTGDRGKGKTNFCLGSSLMLSQLMPRETGPAFKWDHISYRYEDIGDIVEQAGEMDNKIYAVDEAVDAANSKDAMTRANKELSKFMQKARKRKNIYFWAIPDFTELDSSIRNKVIHYWVHVFHKNEQKERNKSYALAALFRKDLNPFNRDKWGFETNSKITSEPIHDVEGLMSLFTKTKSFIAYLAFPILPAVIEEEYTKLSKEALSQSGRSFKRKTARAGDVQEIAASTKATMYQ